MQKLNLDYFYAAQGEQFAFYQIPKALFTYECFRNLSDTAKILYGILLTRNSLSMKNKWIDNKNRAYIYFTIEEVMETLGCAEGKAVKTMGELDKLGLIEKKRQGQGKPTIIYVKNFASLSQFLNCENRNSKLAKITTQDLRKSQCNYNDFRNNDFNQSIYQEKDVIYRLNYKEIIKENIQYDVIQNNFHCDKKILDEIIELIVEVVCSNKKTIKINGEEIPKEIVKNRFLKLNENHIIYVFESMERNTTKIINIRSYLLTALYNSTLTIDNYYKSVINHDLYGG